jgi:hypothetical protein
VNQAGEPTIRVQAIDETTYEVTVQGHSTTTHTVTLSFEYHAKLTDGRVDPQTLVRRSFEFLLEREPNTSILRRFDLPVIGRYFPEYETTLRDMLRDQGGLGSAP